VDQQKPITSFIETHFLHFNAASVVDAAQGYKKMLREGGKMMVTLAGAMSTAELGKSLAQMIREDKVHIICCTGANLEEDIFNLVAHDHYRRVPNYRDLTPQDEMALLEAHYNRVTDTCIPEEEAMRHLEHHMVECWSRADGEGKRYLPHEYIYQLLELGVLESKFQINPRDSRVMAAYEKKLQQVVTAW
jgi:deoxyhypusine synthase